MKRFALALLLSAVGCAAQLATLPPSDTYTVIEGDSPQLTKDEQKLLDAINKEFARLGLPAATPGSYEQNVAAIMANAALAKVWYGSGRAIAEPNPALVAPPVSNQQTVDAKHEVAHGRLASLTDEEDDGQLKHLHAGQHLTAYGIPLNISARIYQTTYAHTTLDGDELKNLALGLRPAVVTGELKMGVVILPVGDADQRLFAVSIRDRTFDLSKGPPRITTPGTSFEVAGKVYNHNLKNIELGLLGPDGKVQLARTPVDLQGNFTTSMSIPNLAGLYVLAVGDASDFDTVKVPIFAGITPTPWPVSADPKATPVDGTRAIAQRLAKAIAEWRHSHGLSDVAIDSGLSAFAKSEALLYAKAADASTGDSSGTPFFDLNFAAADRARAAGFDPQKIEHRWSLAPDDYVNDFFARFPDGPFRAAELSSPSMDKIGIGVTLVPTEISKSDGATYSISWVLQDPTPPSSETAKPAASSAPQSFTVAVRADGTVAVDGAQVDDAQLKLKADEAKALNADTTAILQVEPGAKPELVQHIIDLVKGEGITSVNSHTADAPAAAPAAPTSAPAAPAAPASSPIAPKL